MAHTLIILGLSAILFGKSISPSEANLTYTWTFAGDTIAMLNVPKGFKESHRAYGEGVVTTLTYIDSSYIILHYGFSMSLPLFKTPEFLIYDKVNNANRTIRRGRIQHTKLRWREDNMNAIPINVGFAKVPANRVEIFEQSLTGIVVTKKISAP